MPARGFRDTGRTPIEGWNWTGKTPQNRAIPIGEYRPPVPGPTGINNPGGVPGVPGEMQWNPGSPGHPRPVQTYPPTGEIGGRPEWWRASQGGQPGVQQWAQQRVNRMGGIGNVYNKFQNMGGMTPFRAMLQQRFGPQMASTLIDVLRGMWQSQQQQGQY